MKTYNIEEFKKVVANSLSIFQVMRQFHVARTTANKLIEKNNISIKHFQPMGTREHKHRVLKNCPVCEKEFLTHNYRKPQVTCSRSCANVHFNSGIKGDRCINGNTIYRKTCFEHYEHKCLICNEDKAVDIHHIDHNRKNNLPENLIPLCPTHHRYMHRKKLKPLIYDKILESIKKI